MRVLPALLLGIAAAAPARAATLRTMTSLSAPVVLVSDLFDGAGAEAARVLGPAPPPGERIVVEAPQLAAIARQFHVDWRPASSADRAVLDRPGRLLPRQMLLDALDAALVNAGAPALNDIDLPDFEPPLVPLGSQPHTLVEQMEYQRDSGRFTADVLVSGDAMPPMRLRLVGNVAEVAEVAVPSRRLAAGSVLRPGDLVPARVRSASLRGEAVRDLEQAAGMAVRRAIMPGQPLLIADLQRPIVVAKGAHVAMELRSPGLAVAAQGIALAAGAVGERIQVLNPSSRMVVDGEITGTDRVAVAPDSVPLPADARLISALGVAP